MKIAMPDVFVPVLLPNQNNKVSSEQCGSLAGELPVQMLSG